MIEAKVKVTCPSTRQFILETGSGHHLIIDDSIGKTGPKPIELMAGALAGCTAFDVITILRNKKHKDVISYEVSVQAEQMQSPPKVFTDVFIHHKLTGDDLDARSVEDAIELSEEKYCSVGAMVRLSGAEMKTTYSIYDSNGKLIATTKRPQLVTA
ncbi:MAG TPA: OsmC family protein [Candidatus Angelobacter sp.]|nr:OsmC family protein [Candidatus Angelobacter sp.]